MAVDRTEVQDQAPEQGVADAVDAASDQGQEQGGIGGWFRSLLGKRDAGPAEDPASGDGQPEEPADQGATTQPAQPPADDAERIRREAQSLADRVIARREWGLATRMADRGDTSLLREMAERGDGRAQKELAERGETYELGEARAKELKQQTEHESLGQSLTGLANVFDTATIKPILDELPESVKKEANAAFERAGGGIDGREALVKAALKGYARSIREESDTAFLDRIEKDPVLRKQAMAKLRGLEDFDEPDLVGAVSGSAASDDANAAIRALFGR